MPGRDRLAVAAATATTTDARQRAREKGNGTTGARRHRRNRATSRRVSAAVCRPSRCAVPPSIRIRGRATQPNLPRAPPNDWRARTGTERPARRNAPYAFPHHAPSVPAAQHRRAFLHPYARDIRTILFAFRRCAHNRDISFQRLLRLTKTMFYCYSLLSSIINAFRY